MSYPPNQPPSYPPGGSGAANQPPYGGPHYGQPQSGPQQTGPSGPGGYGRPAGPYNGNGVPPTAPGSPGHPGTPGGYGGPGYNPYGPGKPEKKSNKGLIFGIIGAVVVLAGLIFGGIALLGDSDSKGVSRSDFDAGLKKTFTQMLGEDAEDLNIDSLVTCVSDKTYDELDDEQRQAVADAEKFKSDVLVQAVETCLTSLLDGAFDDLDLDEDSEDLDNNDNSSEPATDDPTDSEDTSPQEDPTSEETSSEAGQTDNNSHPVGGVTREQYKAGMEKIFTDAAEMGYWGELDVPALAQCMVEESYDKVSEDTRRKVASGQDVDDQALYDAGVTCGERLAESMIGDN